MVSSCLNLLILFAVVSLPVRSADTPLDAAVHFPGFVLKGRELALPVNSSPNPERQAWQQLNVTDFLIKGDRLDSTYIALEFSSLPSKFVITVTPIDGPAGARPDVYTEKDLQPNAATFSTLPVVGSVLQLSLQQPAGADTHSPESFVLVSIWVGSRQKTQTWLPPFEGVCGTDQSKNVACWGSSSALYQASRPVARLIIENRFVCTGFLIHNLDVLLTNWHCISSQTQADQAVFEFGAEAPNCGDSNYQLAYRGFQIRGGKFLGGSSILDFAVVQLSSSASGTYGVATLDFNTNSAKKGQKIYIPQHPSGYAKVIAAQIDGGGDAVLTDDVSPCSGGNYRDLGYMADTQGGSSGSPVFSLTTNKVIALHHCGGCANRAVAMNSLQNDMSNILASTCFSDKDCRGAPCSWTSLSTVGTCAANPCVGINCGNGACAPSGTSYICRCDAGWTGGFCNINIDECAIRPCQNGGTCIDGIRSFTCTCPVGFTGAQCQTNINDCFPNPCQNGGICVDMINAFTCTCQAGYTGDRCQTNINECASSPCLNGAPCTDGINDFTCACPVGYTGKTCQTNIDDCAPQPCQNGGSCTDGVNSFSCACQIGFTGNTCQTNIDDCQSKPCQNGGSCTDGFNTYTCACQAGYSGSRCETSLDLCSSSPCLNGATCVNRGDTFTCSCPLTHTGTLCDLEFSGKTAISFSAPVQRREGNAADTYIMV
eukprot:g19880.t1